ncbi:MAG: response regulator transcription factor [Magnetococcales bacterium]|nr:response regulator transcription factor [Magnetococcales bacterium]NGZ27840.1 response regulator transcription factor [Magnetococcales bacterium]
MIRLVLADDHTIFRQGLARLLQSGKKIKLLSEAGDGQQAWQLIRELQPDIALLDISMPGMSGIEVAKLIIEEGLPTRIVLLTMHDDPALAAEAKQTGAHGYVLKDNTFEELLEAVETVANGGTFMSRPVSDKLNDFMEQGGYPVLSPRERQVLQGIASGQTNKEIARNLKISPKTVETHRSRLMEKLNRRTSAELVRYAVKTGLV